MREARIWMAIALIGALPMMAHAQSSVGVDARISDGPTTLRFSYRTQPDVVYVRDADVYVVQDRRCNDDMFRYRDAWWVMRDDHWYRCSSWRGPFMRVQDRAVPVAVWRVPDRHWKHHPHRMGPARGQRREMAERRGHEHVREHDRD